MRQKEKKLVRLTFQDALENFSNLSELEPSSQIGIVRDQKLILQDEVFPEELVDWVSIERISDVLDLVKISYAKVSQYLKDFEEDPSTDWSDEKLKKSIQANLLLVGEATRQLESFLFASHSSERILESLEYRELQEFYLEKISPHFEGGLEGEVALELENEEERHKVQEIKDFESVRFDREYELFYMRNEEEKPFFSPALLKNLKLYCDFDETYGKSFEEDPLLKIPFMKDREMQQIAVQILYQADPYIRDFYKQKIPFQDHLLADNLSKAIFALMLASNGKNLMQNTTGKSCSQYFEDFQFFLHAALLSHEYEQSLAYPESQRVSFIQGMMSLVHQVCKAFFLNKSSVQGEFLDFIDRLIRIGEGKKRAEGVSISQSSSFFGNILQEEDDIQKILAVYPSGPLFKDLDVVRREEKDYVAFQPVLQGNLPHFLYEIISGPRTIDVLKLPAPTSQEFISKAEVLPEYMGFLRAYSEEDEKKKHLFFNLQDKTSWKEYSRAHTIEEFHKSIEFGEVASVMTLAKNTSFYFQGEEYLSINDAKEFILSFKKQFERPEECGFSMPKTLQIQSWIDDLLLTIYEVFFEEKKELSRKNRKDFIEIFYFFLILKGIDVFRPNSLSFSCKDALDIGAVQSGGFYLFLKILSREELGKEESSFSKWLFFAQAFLVRERSVDSERLLRMISSLVLFEEKLKDRHALLLKKLSSCYSPKFLSSLKMKQK